MGARNLNPQIERILMTESLSDRDLLLLAKAGEVAHVIQENGWRPERGMEIARKMVLDPKSFIRDPLQVLIESNESQSGRSFLFRCGADEKKNRMLDEFDKFLNVSTSTRRRSDVACLIMDELYTNASRNARQMPVNLVDGPGVRLVESFAFATREQLVLGCRDSFGRLHIPALLERIGACVTVGVGESVQLGTEGAGIGSFLVFDACDSYFVAVHEARATVVGGIIALDTVAGSRSTIERRPKQIHLINIAD